MFIATEGVVAEGGTKERISRTSAPDQSVHPSSRDNSSKAAFLYVFLSNSKEKGGIDGSSMGQNFFSSPQTYFFLMQHVLSNQSHF